MRYRGNNICPDEQTDELGGRTSARKHNVLADIVEWRGHNKHCNSVEQYVQIPGTEDTHVAWEMTGQHVYRPRLPSQCPLLNIKQKRNQTLASNIKCRTHYVLNSFTR